MSLLGPPAKADAPRARHVERILGDLAPVDVLRPLAGAEATDMTHLALSLSGFVNGVSRRHTEVARPLYPGHRIRATTNGVHVGQWAHPAMSRLFDERLPGWRQDPEILLRADRLAGRRSRRRTGWPRRRSSARSRPAPAGGSTPISPPSSSRGA